MPHSEAAEECRQKIGNNQRCQRDSSASFPCGDSRLGKLADDNMALVVTFGADFEIWLRRAVHRHGQSSTNLSHPLVCQPSNPFDENGNRHAFQ